MVLPTPKHPDGYTIREIGYKIGMKTPISVMDVRTQDEMEGWNFMDMVEHFEDDDRKYNLAMSKTLSEDLYQESTNGDDEGGKGGEVGAETGNTSSSFCNSISSGEKPEADSGSSVALNQVRTNASKQNDAPPIHLPVIIPTESQQHKQNKISKPTRTSPSLKRKRRHNMSRVLNQISLEFSPTPFAKQVKSPQFVRDIDWIDSVWPYQRRKEEDYPRVQYYCLTSTAGCYTDFHVDFGGTSVWYHILSGEKVFLLIPPNQDNLALYEKWLCRKDQNDVFFPDMKAKRSSIGGISDSNNEMKVTGCNKIKLQQGQTLIIPTGWLHAVYTPVDTLVIGGNFLHGLDMKGQLNIHCLETRTRVPAKFRFPSFVQLMFYAGKEYYKRLRDPSKYGSLHPDEVDGLTVLLEALKAWNVGPGGDAGRFGSVAYVILECLAEVKALFGIHSVDAFFLSFELEMSRVKANDGQVTFSPTPKQSGHISEDTVNRKVDSFTDLAASPKPKIKLSIKRKVPTTTSPTPAPDHFVNSNPQIMIPTQIKANSPKLQLKLKSKINDAIPTPILPGRIKFNESEDDEIGVDAFPELQRKELEKQQLYIPTTKALSMPKPRTSDLVSSHRMRDDDEWLPEAEKKNETVESAPLITKRTKIKKNTKGTRPEGAPKRKKAVGSSRARLMKKLKF